MSKRKEQDINSKNWPVLVKLIKRLARSSTAKLTPTEATLLGSLDGRKLPACNPECRDFQKRGLAYDFDTRLIAYLTTNPIFPKEDRALLLDVVMRYHPSTDDPLERLSVHVLREFRKALTRPLHELKEKVAELTREIEQKEEYLAKLLHEIDYLMQEILQESAGKIIKSESVVIRAFDEALPNDEIIQLIKNQNRQIIQFFKEESFKASIDPLTGVYNRGALDRFLTQALYECNAEQAPLALLMIDIDHFKRFNDTYGHLIGDEVLKYVAQTGIMKKLKGFEASFCGKYGGEEFVVVLRGMNLRSAASIAETIRSNIEAKEFSCEIRDSDGIENKQIVKEHITVSIGVSELQEGQQDAKTLIGQADKALYEAKNNGRNRVCCC